VSEVNKLQSIPPTNLSPEEILVWIKNQAEKTSAMCDEARQHWERLQNYHKNVAELMSELVALEKKQGDNRDAIQEIAEAAEEVFEAIIAVNTDRMISNEAVEIGEAERELLGDENSEIDRQYEASRQKFLRAYNSYKSKLGLSNRDEVAKLTGINARYISEIESGRHKPQFKTVKRIADAFGADVTEFLD